ncbi:hypothetical protein D3C85_1431640 [compost metagenome]
MSYVYFHEERQDLGYRDEKRAGKEALEDDSAPIKDGSVLRREHISGLSRQTVGSQRDRAGAGFKRSDLVVTPSRIARDMGAYSRDHEPRPRVIIFSSEG